MCTLYQSVGTNLLYCLVVDLMCLSLHIGIGHKCRHHLLVAILGKLQLKRLQRVVFCIECSSHLQFIINKEVYILLHALPVDNTLRIVLIERIFKLRTRNGVAVDHHNHRIVSLRTHCATGQQSGNKQFQFHISIREIQFIRCFY